MKKIVFGLLMSFIILFSSSEYNVFAQSDSSDGEDVKFEILPKAEDNLSAKYQEIKNKNGEKSVWDIYNEIASGSNTPDQVDEQIASGIMTRDTLFNYGILLLRFFSQIGLAIGGLMFVYVGYQYIMGVLTGESPDQSLIQKAVMGILVIIFSYAIMRILTRAFLT